MAVNKVMYGQNTIIDISDTTATASDVASGKYFYTNAGVKTEGTSSGGGGGASLGTKTITANGTYDAEDDGYDGYSSVNVNVSGGGGGIGTLLKAVPLGTITTSSTNATDTGLTVTVDNINSYDILIVEISVDTVISGRHIATICTLPLAGTSNIDTKGTVGTNSQRQNIKKSSAGVVSSSNSGTAYGIYTLNPTISNGSLTFQIYKRYNNNSTGTINGAYTARVYGINLYDLIGG